MPICVAVSGSTGCAAMVMSALCAAVRVDELAVVHPVQVVAGQDEVVVGVVLREVARRLADGIGRALVPVRIVGGLLGREDLDEPAREPSPAGTCSRCAG